ncbi:hypothetical protein FQN60_016780, partial [Etheostoma spectabile]
QHPGHPVAGCSPHPGNLEYAEAPPQLYTQTGRLTKGGVSLPVYRCARGSTSLESFHLHLNRFIPGTRASALHFQAFLVDGLEEMQGPDGQPGYQHVLRLAQALLEARSLLGLSDRRVDRLIVLWYQLPEHDKRRVVYPPRYRERQPKGRFKAAKGTNTSCPGKESLQRSLLGPNSGPANWPSASRLVEAICSQLCQLHPKGTRSGGIRRDRWALVLSDYVAIRAAVLASLRLMAQTDIQLFELNQRTLSQWFSRRQKEEEKAVLLQASGVMPVAALAGEPLPPAKGLSSVQVGSIQAHLEAHTNASSSEPSSSSTPPVLLPAFLFLHGSQGPLSSGRGRRPKLP